MGTNIAIGNLVGKCNTDTQKINFPFSNSLVDYWNFGGKSNFDKDRTTVTGLLGNVLTAYNFVWSLGSGYGLYKTNFLQWVYISSRGTAVVTSDTIHLTETFGNANVVELNNLAYNSSENITVDVSGDFGGVYLIYIYYTSETESATVIINTPGRYELPKTNSVNAGFKTNKAAKLDLTIKQIPEYEGAIVTDGIDDYLKLDKTGYKVGTVIIKYKPVRLTNNWQYVLEAATDRTYITHNSVNGPTITNFDNYNTVGDYEVGIINTPRLIETPLYISCNKSIKEFISMALYSIAIYDRALSDQEVQEVINFMDKENKS